MNRERYETFGYTLAMEVLQSELYKRLDDKSRAECDELIQRGMRGLEAGEPSGMVAVPEGYKLVPCEPTEEMVRAAYADQPNAINAGFAQAYAAMLSAAPEVKP